MIICLSFIGTLPSYIVECVHQIRLFFSGDVYLIINDLESPYIDVMKQLDFKVIVVDYAYVRSLVFDDLVSRKREKLFYIEDLKGREELILRSFERFFLLQNLMMGGHWNDGGNLKDCLFLELDNLIYDDPNKWVDIFSKNELCYMFDNMNRCSSGIMYVKSWNSLTGFLNECVEYIENNEDEFLCEMNALFYYYLKERESVQLLPIYWNNTLWYSELSYMGYKGFGGWGDWDGCIFDAAGIGIYLLGIDPFHTNGEIILNQRAQWSQIDYTIENIKWEVDDLGFRRPFVWGNGRWILVNNLHVHSKDLKSGLSKPLMVSNEV